MNGQSSLFDLLATPPELDQFAYTPSCGNWPGCERYTYRGGGKPGRCWVCSPDDGEALCAWCVGHAEWVKQVDIDNARYAAERSAAYWAAPFHTRFKRTEVDGRYLFGLIDTYGSPWTAIEAIVANRDGLRCDFERYVVTLLAWHAPTGAVFGELWFELIAQSERLLAVGAAR